MDIYDGNFLARIGIIKSVASHRNSSRKQGQNNVSKSNASSGKWHYCDEPEIMKKLNINFLEKFAFFSSFDLFLWGIEAFTPIHLAADRVEAIFIAIPYDNLQIGTLCLYEEGITQHFPVSNTVSLVVVTKLKNVKPAKEVELKTLGSKNELTIQKFKQKFKYEYTYGIPFLFRNVDTITLENKDDIVSLQLKVSVKDEHICEQGGDASLLEKTAQPFSTETEVKNQDEFFLNSDVINAVNNSFFGTSPALDEMSEDLGDMEHTKLERESIASEISFHAGFKTSTPWKDETRNPFLTNIISEKKQKKRRWMVRTTKNLSINEPEENVLKCNAFYYLLNDTQIQMASEKLEGQSTRKEIQYYKDNNFYSLKALIEKKLSSTNKGRNIQCSWTGILLSGLPGTGKNLLIKKVSSELGLPLIILSLLGWSVSSFSNYVMDCFNEAKNCAPSVLLFDELDSLCHEKSANEFTNEIVKVIESSKTLTKDVILVGTTNREEAIPKIMKQGGRFDKEVILSLPEPGIRSKMVWQHLTGLKHNLTQEEVKCLAQKALGFSGADLNCSVRIAWQNAVNRWKNSKKTCELCLCFEDFKEGIGSVIPSFLRQNYSAVSKVQWSDILGYDHIKEKLKKMVAGSLRVKCLKGVLLYGPPGCSKTMLVRALASETRFTFFPVKCSDLLSKYVGESENSVCRVFEKAWQSAPSIVFMDEVDSLCGERGGAGAESGLVHELLSLMRKCLAKGNVLVVGATNRPQAIDEALLSPGCFEQQLHVALPDCASRCALWKGLLEEVPHAGVNVATLCANTDGFSCAEICSAYQKATHSLLKSLHLDMLKMHDPFLTEPLILEAICCTTRRTSKSVLAAIESFAGGS